MAFPAQVFPCSGLMGRGDADDQDYLASDFSQAQVSGAGRLAALLGLTPVALVACGDYLATGPLVETISKAATGAGRAGWIGGSLAALGIPVNQARRYEDRVRLGNILISVATESIAEAMQSKFIFTRGRAHEICITEMPVVASWEEQENSRNLEPATSWAALQQPGNFAAPSLLPSSV